jgi:hypothetical protein
MLQFTVEKKYLKGQPVVLAKFDNETDARNFIAMKLEEDALVKANVTYLLLEMGEEMESFDQSGAAATATSGGQSAGGQSQSSAQNFRPSPMQTTLRPSGMPHSSFKADKPADDKDKK